MDLFMGVVDIRDVGLLLRFLNRPGVLTRIKDLSKDLYC